jgi:hypothetical protein
MAGKARDVSDAKSCVSSIQKEREKVFDGMSLFFADTCDITVLYIIYLCAHHHTILQQRQRQCGPFSNPKLQTRRVSSENVSRGRQPTRYFVPKEI